MKTIFSLVIIFCLVSCTESTTRYKAFLVNNSSQKIEIHFFKQGVVAQKDIIVLSPNASQLIADGSQRGLDHGFHSDHLTGCDSAMVVFGDTVSVLHYGITPAFPAPKYIEYNSKRNVLHIISYEEKVEGVSKTKKELTYTYTFVEKDYLDAR